MFPIDFVITEVNDLDPNWFEDFNKYKKLELEDGSNYESERDDQAFGEERFRDWHTLKYWFRGVDTCCPWVNKVFLIVSSEGQVPDWLDRDNPKLRIVYHEEYIPSEFLPTFNARTIMTFIPKIKDLSEHYVYFDNDCYLLNPISSDRFFNAEGKPLCSNNRVDVNTVFSQFMGNWGYSVDNTYQLEKKYNAENVKYGIEHLYKVQLKSIGLQILEENYDDIYNSLIISKFRRRENFLPTFLITNVIKHLKLCEFKACLYKNCEYASIFGDTNFDKYKDCQIVCFNDIGGDYDFEKCRERLLQFFEKQLPNKCRFEK